MCDFATAVAAAGVVATIGSTAVAYQGSQQQAAAAEYSGQVAQVQAENQRRANEYQAQVASNNADAVRKQGEAAAAEQQRQNAARLGQQRAVFAANGLDPNSGSALTIQEDSAEAGGLDVANTRYNAGLRALGLNQEADMYRQAGANAVTAGKINAATASMQADSAALSGYGSLLSGVSQFSSRWDTFSKTEGYRKMFG